MTSCYPVALHAKISYSTLIVTFAALNVLKWESKLTEHIFFSDFFFLHVYIKIYKDKKYYIHLKLGIKNKTNEHSLKHMILIKY